MILPVNTRLECFIVLVYRNNAWRKVCHPHAPGVSYKFFTYNDADDWARRNLDDFHFEVEPQTLFFSRRTGQWQEPHLLAASA